MKAFDLGVQTHCCISITCDMCHKVHNLVVIIIGEILKLERMTYCFLTNYSGFKVIPLIISVQSHAFWYTSWSMKGKRRAKASFLVIYQYSVQWSEAAHKKYALQETECHGRKTKIKFKSLKYSSLGTKDRLSRLLSFNDIPHSNNMKWLFSHFNKNQDLRSTLFLVISILNSIFYNRHQWLIIQQAFPRSSLKTKHWCCSEICPTLKD